ncbi:MAG: hypothetical protein ACI87J_001718 [Colwellia sp.]|jgi:hypothetical protein
MTPLVPKGDTSGSDKKGIFNRSKFTYDKEKDVYICPNNSQLMPDKTMTKDRDLYFVACSHNVPKVQHHEKYRDGSIKTE